MSDQFNPLENSTIGKNIGLYRRVRNLKAADVAEQVGLSEGAYTKYERGETQITVDFLRRIGEVLRIDPLTLLTTPPGTFIDSINNNTDAIVIGSNNQLSNQKQTELIIRLIETVTAMSDRMLKLLEKQ